MPPFLRLKGARASAIRGRTRASSPGDPGGGAPSPPVEFTPSPGQAALPDPSFRRNFSLGVINGVLFNIAAAFASVRLVFPGLILLLGGSNVLVGLLCAFDNGGWLLPQLLVGAQIQSLPRKMVIYQATAIARAILFALLVLIVALSGHLPSAMTLAAVIVLYCLYALAGGWAGIPFQEVVAKTIPPDRRGTYFGLRLFGGGLVTLVVVSPLVSAILAEGSGWSFPYNYALLFGLAFIFVMGGLVSFGLVVEPPSREVGSAGTLAQQLRRLPALWRDNPHMGRFTLYRSLASLVLIAEPFYIVYVTEVMGAPPSMIGQYMGVITLVSLISYLVWSRLSDRRGNRLLLRVGTGLVAVAPPLALLLPALGRLLGLSLTANAYLFALVFIFSGLGNAGLNIGLNNYILELFAERDRPAALGLVNTIAGAATILTILGGEVADLAGYQPLFLVATVLGVAGFLLSLPLMEPRGKG